MKQNNILDIITYVSITLMIILVIVFLKYKFSLNNQKEHFSVPERIIIKDNFYDITSADKSPIFANQPIVNLFNREGSTNNKLGASNLCIYKTNAQNTEVTDIECISSGEMQNALNLPEFRKTNVCIDEECINLEDIYILTGQKQFQLVNNSYNRPTRENKDSLNCMRYRNNPGFPALSCAGKSIQYTDTSRGVNIGIPTLTIDKCNTNNNSFIMTPGNFTKAMARDADPKFGMHVQNTGSGSGGSSLVPSHD
jgi:hypothetical protein